MRSLRTGTDPSRWAGVDNMAFNCDHLRLEDTKLILEVACDLIVYGNKLVLSIENLLRDGIGQSLVVKAQVYRQPIERLQHAFSVKALGM